MLKYSNRCAHFIYLIPTTMSVDSHGIAATKFDSILFISLCLFFITLVYLANVWHYQNLTKAKHETEMRPSYYEKLEIFYSSPLNVFGRR
jgi:hypothetical protein